MEAVELVMKGESVRKVARHYGFAHNTVLNWLKRKPEYGQRNQLVIPTLSSRPHHHSKELSPEIVSRILALRNERNQCAEILHHRLEKEGILISISSVKRVLRRAGCSRFSKWKKWHQYPEKPMPKSPGVLVQIDSMMDGEPKDRLSAYALIDVYSRWAYAWPIDQPNSHLSTLFVNKAQAVSPFRFQSIQSDHGSEFSKWFTKVIEYQGIQHLHSRVRKPTDNGYVERFNQTLQKDCLNRIPRSMKSWQRQIPEFLNYYNNERPHMGLDYKTPMEMVRSY